MSTTNSNAINGGSAQVKPPYDEATTKGRNYEEVMSQFQSAGFNNIRTELVRDKAGMGKEGEVESITVGGDANYSMSNNYNQDVPVVIRYYAFADE